MTRRQHQSVAGMIVKRFLQLLLGLAVLAVTIGYVWLYTPSIPRPALERLYANEASRFLDLPSGTRIHYRDEGPRDAPLTVLLLHGTASSLHTWEGWVAGLKDHYRVVTMDLPAHGLTGRTAEDRYDRAGMVAAIAAVVDHLGLDRFVIGGNSMGGEMAMAYALAHPEQVQGLILVDSAGLAFRPEHTPVGFRLAMISWLRPLIVRITPRSLIARSIAAVYGDPGRITPALVDRYWRLLRMEGSRKALMKRFAVFASEPPLPVERIDRPALVLWGREDRLIPLSVGKALARRLPQAQLVVFDGLGHVPQEEDPARSLVPVKAFLAQLAAASPKTEDAEQEAHG